MKNLKLLIVFKVTALTMSSNLIFANDLTVRFRVAKTDQLLQTGSARAVGAAYHTSSIKQKNKSKCPLICWLAKKDRKLKTD